MVRAASVFALLAVVALGARAGEDVAPPAKSLAPAKSAFALPASPGVPGLEQPWRMEEALAPPRTRCRLALCYQGADGQLAIREARQYMPAVEGLTAEGISLRSRRVTFRYSF